MLQLHPPPQASARLGLGLGLGSRVGAGAGLLSAPQSRDNIAPPAQRGYEQAKSSVQSLPGSVGDRGGAAGGWAGARGSRSGLRASFADEDEGPPPPYASQSISSGAALGLGAGAGVSSSTSSLLPPKPSADPSPKSNHNSNAAADLSPAMGGAPSAGTEARQQRLLQAQADHAARSQAKEEARETKQAERRRRAELEEQREALKDGALTDERAYLEAMRRHTQLTAEAQLKRQADKETRARERTEASAKRAEARESRKLQQQAEGISLRATEIFELAALSPGERDNNARKLRAFLDVHGEFPPRYRNLIWRFCLQLPENAAAFAALRDRGTHPACEHMHEQHPIADPALAARLQRLCSQLCHWSTVLGEAPFLPQLAFPFAVQFGGDDLSAFEAVASIFMWWGHTFFCMFPGDPSHITGLS